jgi:hypothetical protein
MPQDEFKDVAARFLDAWQEQLAASFRDPEAITRNMQAMQHYAQAYFEGVQKAPREKQHGKPTESADVSISRNELHRLHARLEAMERRLTQLEIGKPSKGKKPRKGG